MDLHIYEIHSLIFNNQLPRQPEEASTIKQPKQQLEEKILINLK